MLTVSLIPAFVGETHFAFLGYSLAHRLTPLRRELDYIRTLGTSKESAKETQLFALGQHLWDRFARTNQTLIASNRALQIRRLRLGAVLAVIGLLGFYGSYTYIVWRTLQGQLTIGTLTFLAGALGGTSSQIQAVFAIFANIADQALFLSDLRDFFAVAPKIRAKSDGLPVARPIRDGFEFRNVSFHYPDSDRLVLDRLDLRIAPTERIALVGENGQGKTTIVKLLTHLYEPTSGQILLDGVDLREYSIEDLHRQIGVIFQDFVRYDMTARENIGLGRVDQLDNETRILEAAWSSHATEIIDRLPGGLESHARPQIRGRRRALRRRMATHRLGARLHARRADSDSGRADGGPRCCGRVRPLLQICRADRRANGRADFAPLLDGSDVRPHRRPGGWTRSRRRLARSTH